MSRPRTFRSPRGTVDILPEDQGLWRYFASRGDEIASTFGYERIDTPTFEDADLFVRGTGEITDIVENETYTFEDRGGDLLTLRPEGTPPVCRAYLQHGMHNLPQPVRLYYAGPFFRYDRPQAGRYRQLHQFGVEVVGESDASIDAEVIELACPGGASTPTRFGCSTARTTPANRSSRRRRAPSTACAAPARPTGARSWDT